MGSRRTKDDLAAQHPLAILIAEDNTVNQRVLQAMLSSLGYDADLVADGAEAIEAVRNKPYELVFMDVRMPRMDGVEACRRIRTMDGPRPTIVALTAAATAEERRACLDAGMDAFVTKPVTFDGLIERLSKCRRRDTAA